ncbi:MAG: hypothetical protein C3F02_01020 [Parcubacteria group bacterium]|nr:MAG: hypothetical protein C3F02_01020 [Parcubacteria group bacterium]
MQSYRKQTFRVYLRHLGKYKLTVVVAMVATIVAQVANIIGPLFYKDFFNVLTDAGDLSGKVPVLQHILIKILLLYFIGWVLWRTATFCASYWQAHAEEDIYNSCFSYLHKHSINFFNSNFVGSLVKKVNRFADTFMGISDIFMWDILTLFVFLSLSIIVLFQRNIWLGLGLLVWSVVYMIVSYSYSIYKLRYDIKKAALSSKMVGILADTFTNQLNVKLFTGYQREMKYFGRVNNDYHTLRLKTWNMDNTFEAVQALFSIGLEIGIFFLAIHLWQTNVITIGDFFLIQAYILGVIMRLWNFARIIRRFYEYMANAEEMTEIFETPHELSDSLQAKNLTVSEGRIVFQDITFNYNQTRRIISRFNLEINPGEKIALVGSSGSGKSTIVNLLLRVFDVERGHILIDGQKIETVTQESLWQNIAMVNQDPILFHRTLAENIRYGRPNATEIEVIKAARLAHAHEFISTFNDGYKTYVGERGVKLSGGERQRVAIARAILKNAPILILDEATSSLDSESEHLIQDALSNLMRDKTVIVIAHRLSTIMKMDRIVMIDDGKIVEQGTHQELLKIRGGLYRSHWERQAGGFIN